MLQKYFNMSKTNHWAIETNHAAKAIKHHLGFQFYFIMRLLWTRLISCCAPVAAILCWLWFIVCCYPGRCSADIHQSQTISASWHQSQIVSASWHSAWECVPPNLLMYVTTVTLSSFICMVILLLWLAKHCRAKKAKIVVVRGFH